MKMQIRKMRGDRNVTQKELAESIGATIRQIGYWEKGNITLADACKVADFFNCTLDELVGREWHEPNSDIHDDKLVDMDKLADIYRSMGDGVDHG